jgi:hypothetical protein
MSNFKAIQYLYPNAEFTITDDDVSTIVWKTEGITIPNPQQIQDALDAIAIAEAQVIADKAAALAAAEAKLAALGLSATEVAALLSK